MSTIIRIGVVGCGAIAQIMHIPYLLEHHDRFDLVSLCDLDESVLHAVANRFGIEKRYTDFSEQLANDALDAILIAHAGSHYHTMKSALDAGLHILCEKPLAWNLRQVEEIVAQSKVSHRVVQLGYHKLYDPAFDYTRDRIAEMRDKGYAKIQVLHPANELGFVPHRLRKSNNIIESGHRDPGTWDEQLQGQLNAFASGTLAPIVDEALGERKDRPELRLAFGLVTISLIHQIYMMYGLFGEPERVLHTDIWRDGFSIQSHIQYPDDFRVTLDWHFLSHLADYRETYDVYGNYDRVQLRFPSPYFRHFPSPITVMSGQGDMTQETTITVGYEEAFENELLAFYDNIQTGNTPISSVDDALKHTRFGQSIIDAIV